MQVNNVNAVNPNFNGFVKVQDDILNTDHIVKIRREGKNLLVSMSGDYNDTVLYNVDGKKFKDCLNKAHRENKIVNYKA